MDNRVIPSSFLAARHTSLTLVACAGLLATSLLAGCQQSPVATAAPPPPEVSIEFPTSEEVLEFEETTGRLVAREAVEIRSRVSGYLDKAFFTDGANIQAGQALFRIDARPYEAELARATANVEQSKARLERLKRQEERAHKLFEKKNTTQEDVDLISADRAEAEAGLDALVAARGLAELNCEFTRISSPISGRISRRLVDPGNLIKADDTPLVSVMSLNPIFAYFDIDERTVLRFERLIREGKVKSPRDSKYEVQFALADEDGFSRVGTIDFLDNHISATTGTLRLRATVENDNLLLTPGMFIRLHVPIGVPHPAILVPEEALGSDQGQRYVYVLNEKDEATYRRVKIGMLKSGRRVIEEGLTTTDRVVVSGLQRVRIGSKVQPKMANAKSAEKAEKVASPPPVVPPSASDAKHPIEAKATTDVVGRP
jgi:RND family efflux transporter MFP subunit